MRVMKSLSLSTALCMTLAVSAFAAGPRETPAFKTARTVINALPQSWRGLLIQYLNSSITFRGMNMSFQTVSRTQEVAHPLSDEDIERSLTSFLHLAQDPSLAGQSALSMKMDGLRYTAHLAAQYVLDGKGSQLEKEMLQVARNWESSPEIEDCIVNVRAIMVGAPRLAPNGMMFERRAKAALQAEKIHTMSVRYIPGERPYYVVKLAALSDVGRWMSVVDKTIGGLPVHIQVDNLESQLQKAAQEEFRRFAIDLHTVRFAVRGDNIAAVITFASIADLTRFYQVRQDIIFRGIDIAVDDDNLGPQYEQVAITQFNSHGLSPVSAHYAPDVVPPTLYVVFATEEEVQRAEKTGFGRVRGIRREVVVVQQAAP